jgi:hypothetical protein
MKRTGPISVVALVALVWWCGGSSQASQDRPLPDEETFYREARKKLETDATVQRGYIYVETRREQKLDKDGQVQEESEKVFESYPGLPGEERWERLISENGRPVPTIELEEQDRDRNRQVERVARRFEEQPERERARQQREWEQQRRERAEAIDDIFRVFDIRMIRREVIDRHDTIELLLTPRADARPRTRAGRLMRNFRIRTWISESDHEMVKLQADVIDTVSIGWGLLARLHEGSTLTFLRRKVNGEVWLPAFRSYTGSARVALIRTLRRSATSEFSGYRRYSVDTFTAFEPPATGALD